MAAIGYARVSSAGQSLDIQQEQLTAAGCDKVFSEKRSGRTVQEREQLALALDYVRDGDVFVVTRLDRLARSIGDLRAIVDRLAGKGVGFRALQQPQADTTTAHGRAFLGILGVFAEFEADLRKDRQLEGIAKAKEAGVYKGRPATMDADAVRRLKAEGVRPAEIARRLGLARSSVYRALEDDVEKGG